MNARQLRRLLILVGAAALITLAALVVRRIALPSFTQEDIRASVITTVQSEAQASFLVTGTLDITATTWVESTREVLPWLLDLNLGTSRATVQVPGRVFYGFDVRKLRPEQIRLIGDTLVEIDVPAPEVYSVEPNLSELRVWTQRGWLRSGSSTQRAERRALALVNGALVRQGRTHLANSVQPSVNTARALERMLAPALQAAGMRAPQFRFRIGERIVLEE
jgi:hypothetical protein